MSSESVKSSSDLNVMIPVNAKVTLMIQARGKSWTDHLLHKLPAWPRDGYKAHLLWASQHHPKLKSSKQDLQRSVFQMYFSYNRHPVRVFSYSYLCVRVLIEKKVSHALDILLEREFAHLIQQNSVHWAWRVYNLRWMLSICTCNEQLEHGLQINLIAWNRKSHLHSWNGIPLLQH